MKTYVSIGLQLHLSDVKLKDGKLKSGYIINGAWKLDRFGNKWRCNKYTNMFQIKDEDFILIEVPKKYEDNYNEAIRYANYLYENMQKPSNSKIKAGAKCIWRPSCVKGGPYIVNITGNDHGRVYCLHNGVEYGDYECAFETVEGVEDREN